MELVTSLRVKSRGTFIPVPSSRPRVAVKERGGMGKGEGEGEGEEGWSSVREEVTLDGRVGVAVLEDPGSS
jgi:hypothetical protein